MASLFYPTKNKREVLKLLTEFFVLRTKDLARLIRAREPNENDIRTINRTLKILSDAGWVRRLKYLDPSNEAIPFASGLTDKAVQKYGGKTLDEHSQRTIDHEIDISRFHIGMKEFCAKRKTPLVWQQNHLKLKRGIHPDAHFTVGVNHFFLEIERQRMVGKNGRPAVITKLERYFDYYDTAECENTWGFKRYRIVVVVQTEQRRRHLLEALGSDLKHRMFWVASEHNHLTDFHTPKGDVFSFSDV